MLLQKLQEGIVIGDGGSVWALEKRGYLGHGLATPEACVEYPEAVLELQKEFIRSGADIIQAFTFYGSDDKIGYDGTAINQAAINIAKQAREETSTNVLIAGGISQCPSYLKGLNKEIVKEEHKKQLRLFKDLDFFICEYFEYIEEMEWAIESCKETDSEKPIMATMCIGPMGDLSGKSVQECAQRMKNAGAHIIGVNCHFGPEQSLQTMALMKQELGDSVYLACQPLGLHTDAPREGFIKLPEFPFALEKYTCTRWDIQKFARNAYEMGIKYIGGCCGFEPYHVRAIVEELSSELGKSAESSKKHGNWGALLKKHTKSFVRDRVTKEYWNNLPQKVV
jgi:betaine-homocysteine S-methyltransferase